MKFLVLLSGPVAVGKTTLREQLVNLYGFDYVRSGRYLLNMAQELPAAGTRSELQNLGDDLDAKTEFRWLLDDVALPGFRSNPGIENWLVDAVRKSQQIAHFKEAFGEAVVHVHLTAPEWVLRTRYEARRARNEGAKDQAPYEAAIAHPNEVASRSLIDNADLIIDMSTVTPEEAARRVMQTRPYIPP